MKKISFVLFLFFSLDLSPLEVLIRMRRFDSPSPSYLFYAYTKFIYTQIQGIYYALIGNISSQLCYRPFVIGFKLLRIYQILKRKSLIPLGGTFFCFSIYKHAYTTMNTPCILYLVGMKP